MRARFQQGERNMKKQAPPSIGRIPAVRRTMLDKIKHRSGVTGAA